MLPDFLGRPASIEIAGEFLQVTRVSRCGTLQDAGDPARMRRDYFEVTLEDRTELTVIHDHVTGRWHAQPRRSVSGVIVRFPRAS